MMSSRFSKMTLKAGVAVAIALVALAGCSKSPLGIEAEKPEPKLLTRAPMFISGAQLSSANYEIGQIISAEEGGQLALYDVILDIPPGAVDNDTLFSITIPDITVFYNEFGTDGLEFVKPVTVTMSYREADLSDVNESTIRIAWYNNSTDNFEDVDCAVDFDNKTVTAELYHFSAYGLISDE
jgi:hypothetical protein